MPYADQNEILLQYALENHKNFEVAIGLAYLRDEMRKRVISESLVRLTGVLQKEFGEGWELENGGSREPLARWWVLSARKVMWDPRFSIALCPENNGARGFIIGVRGNPGYSYPNQTPIKLEPEPENAQTVKRTLDEKYRPASQSEWWAWYHFLDGEYRDWDNASVLVQIYSGISIEKISTQFRRIREVAEPVLDVL
ncbi:MAG: hypothetical protein ACE15E_22720 [Acidobacteriota bacterium]